MKFRLIMIFGVSLSAVVAVTWLALAGADSTALMTVVTVLLVPVVVALLPPKPDDDE